MNPPASPLPHAACDNSSDLDTRVRAELLRFVYKDQPLSLLAALVFSVVLTGIAESWADSVLNFVWLAGMSATVAVRYALARRYHALNPPQRDVARWETRLLLGTAATAGFWGMAALYIYVTGSPTLQAVAVLLIGGVVATGSRTTGCHLPSFTAYAVLSGGPLAVHLLLGNTPSSVLIGVLTTLFILLMLGLGRSFRNTVARSFRFQFQNADLAGALQRDVAAREATERALRASEDRLRFAQHALDHSQDPIAILDRDGNILNVSGALCRHTGLTAARLANTKVWDGILAVEPEAYRRKWDTVKAEGASTFEVDVVTGTGERRPMEVNASFVDFDGQEAVCAIGRDLAARRAAEQERARLQHQMQETQRLESLGVLAGGIAHDFNNLLTAILGNATLAKETLNEPEVASEMLGQIEAASNQAAGLCRQMLAYAGRGQLLVEPLNLSVVVAESAKLLETTVECRARLDLKLQSGLPSIFADASQLRQVVLNLVHNAAEAMHGSDGRITVATQTVEIDERLISTARVRTDIAPGEGVALVVRDNGGGMDQKTLDRIFEPFFTTKFAGRGLGLAAVLGIVRSHRALLHVESAPGVGSTFRVVFSAKHAAAASKAPARNTPAARHGGCALVVEDEDAVRHVARQVLERIGYSVELASDGHTAIELVESDPHRFNVLLVGMTMQGMDGAATLTELRRRGANAPAIVMSGLSEEQVRERVDPEQVWTFLQKPFDLSALRGKVESVMDGAVRRHARTL